VQPFRVEVSDDDLAELRRRIRATRWPEPQTVDDHSQGVPLDYLRELCRYWSDGYDWRRCERALNAFPQLRHDVDGLAIHALHVRSPHDGALPLVLTHGWPGSVLEFLDVIAPLTDPADAADAFHLVVPSLPGYGFSGKPSAPGWSAERTAAAWAQLMTDLGYERFAAQGGDWGAVVTTALARHCPDRLAGIHLNMPLGRKPDDDTALSERDQQALAAMARFQREGRGYHIEQSTRPQTIGYALVDSPVALCAWIVEKLLGWADAGTEPPLSKDAMLDDVTLYWLTATGASSARYYWENYRKGRTDPVGVPTGCSLFPGEILPMPRSWADRMYTDIRYWHELDAGGHFAAWEQPALFVDEVREFFRLVR
jgi:pimeloyl-ACP methyl ester carboxylesterase